MYATETAPQPQTEEKSLQDILRGFMAETIERFPELKGRFLILDMNENIVYGNKDIDEKKTGLTPETAPTYLDSFPEVQEMRADRNKPSRGGLITERNLCVILFNDRLDKSLFKNIPEEIEKHILFMLDHELTHFALKDGHAANESLYAHVVAESIADAYALIRHYQRFGINSTYRDRYIDPAGRTSNMVMDIGTGKNHFTTFVLDEIIKRKHLIDFEALDPEQTADLAWRFAMRYLPSRQVIESLYKTFEPVKEAFHASPEAGVKALADLTLNTDGYFTFRAGSVWLNRYLEERKLISGTRRPLDLSEEYLDDAARRLKVKQFKFSAEGILFNVPKAARKPNSAPVNQLTLF